MYPLTKRPQLIDLNTDLVNFKLDFIVEATDISKEFLALVLTQEQLDSVDINKIDMKTAQGKITGSITANNDKYQNYFLVLKKKENDDEGDLNVSVQINIERLEGKPQDITEELSLPSSDVSEEDPGTACVPFYRKPWFWVFVGILILVSILFAYNYFYLKKPFFGNRCPVEPSQPIAQQQQNVIKDSESNLYKQLSEIVK